MIGPLLAFLFTALVCAAFAALTVTGLWRPDAFDYAQIARELAGGHGMSTRHAIYALHLEFLKGHDLLAGDWPNLHRFPLPPLLMAAGFRLFGTSDAVVVGTGIVFQAATAALIFAWARTLAGVWAGAACVLLLTLNGTLLELACSGLSEPPVLFFFTLSLYALWRGRKGSSMGWAVLAGAALGLAGLARTNALFAAPWFVVALLGWGAATPGGLRRAAGGACALLAAVALVSLPWWLRNLAVAGDPFFSLHSYFLLPSGLDAASDKWDLSVPWVRHFTSPWEVLLARPGDVLAKGAGNLSRWLAALPALAGLRGVVPLAVVAAFVRVGDGMRGIAWLVLVSFVWNALLVSFTDFFLLKYHLHLVPALVLLAVCAVWTLAARMARPRWRAAACALAVLLMLDPGGVRDALREVPASTARYDRDHWPVIRRMTREDAVIVSDQSHAVAWETGRRSVRLHYDRTPEGELVLGVLTLEDLYLPVDAVYLSRQFLRDPGKLAALRRTLATQPRFRREFPQLHSFEGGGLLFLRAGRDPAADAPTPRSPARAGAPASPGPPARSAPE